MYSRPANNKKKNLLTQYRSELTALLKTKEDLLPIKKL